MPATSIIALLTMAQNTLPIEKKRELVWLVIFVAIIGVALIMVVMILMGIWRRRVLGLTKERKALAAAMTPDIWKAGGERLVAKMSPFPKPEKDDSPGDDDAPPWSPNTPDDDDPPPTGTGPHG